jgi:hypothetical protein
MAIGDTTLKQNARMLVPHSGRVETQQGLLSFVLNDLANIIQHMCSGAVHGRAETTLRTVDAFASSNLV